MLSFFKKKSKKDSKNNGTEIKNDQNDNLLDNTPSTDSINSNDSHIEDTVTAPADDIITQDTNIIENEQSCDSNSFEPISEISEEISVEPAVESTNLPSEEIKSDSVLEHASERSNEIEVEESIPQSWFQRLKSGLSKSSSKLSDGIASIFTKTKLDDETLEELEDLLLTTDIGVKTTTEIIATISQKKMEKNITPSEVKEIISDKITEILTPIAKPLMIDESLSPHVIMVCGVNGNGKTTTIGKLAKQYNDSGKKVMLVACDTFRAAAVEQLKVWSERSKTEFVSGEPNADPASVAYKAIESAKQTGIDVVMIDTAGRLHNKLNLMQELEKINRVIRKHDETAPHDTILVLDATTGQNAHNQVKTFSEAVGLSGLIVTKLDGTAKGGVVVSLAKEHNIPVHALGVGEAIEDLQAFSPKEFANSLLSL